MKDLPVMPFEMKNLTSFPMEQLCFDLKLEALEQIDAKDVVKLTKVNQGFQGMLVKDPSIVFGPHVSSIGLCNEGIWIKKFSNLKVMELNVDRRVSHFSFVKRIRSCGHLWLGWDSKEALERFFSNFHASIKKEAHLDIDFSAFDDQEIKDLIENFIVARLKDCEKVRIEYYSEDFLRFYYNALLRTQIKNVFMSIYGSIDLFVQQIITNGIPSKNPEAAIFLGSDKIDFTMDPSDYPEMRRIDGESRLWLLKQANDLVRNFGYSRYDGYDFFREESSMFRRRFDSTKDCICVYDNRYNGCFLAFYVLID